VTSDDNFTPVISLSMAPRLLSSRRDWERRIFTPNSSQRRELRVFREPPARTSNPIASFSSYAHRVAAARLLLAFFLPACLRSRLPLTRCKCLLDNVGLISYPPPSLNTFLFERDTFLPDSLLVPKTSPEAFLYVLPIWLNAPDIQSVTRPSVPH